MLILILGFLFYFIQVLVSDPRGMDNGRAFPVADLYEASRDMGYAMGFINAKGNPRGSKDQCYGQNSLVSL